MRSFVKNWTPPALWKILRRGRNAFSAQRTRASSWEEACEAARYSYNFHLLNEFRVARWKHNRKIGKACPLEPNMLLLMAGLFGPGVAITDFGGSTGEYGEAVLALVPSASYTVVENATLISLARKAGVIVEMSEVMPEVCDIFFTSGTLQYLDDPYGLFARGCTTARRAVICMRNSFSERDIFRVQKSRLFGNGAGEVPPGFYDQEIVYPHRTIRESRIRQIAEQNGFRLVARYDDYSGVLQTDEVVYGAQLAFIKA